MSRSIRRVALALIVAFGLLALMMGRWSIAATELTTREDNPRRIFAEQHTWRGAIVDRNDQVLAETIPISGVLERRYPQPDAAPAIGYYSLNYGSTGVVRVSVTTCV
jgi:cell division protein FtsI/penicillin-binding protein 2